MDIAGDIVWNGSSLGTGGEFGALEQFIFCTDDISTMETVEAVASLPVPAQDEVNVNGPPQGQPPFGTRWDGHPPNPRRRTADAGTPPLACGPLHRGVGRTQGARKWSVWSSRTDASGHDAVRLRPGPSPWWALRWDGLGVQAPSQLETSFQTRAVWWCAATTKPPDVGFHKLCTCPEPRRSARGGRERRGREPRQHGRHRRAWKR